MFNILFVSTRRRVEMEEIMKGRDLYAAKFTNSWDDLFPQIAAVHCNMNAKTKSRIDCPLKPDRRSNPRYQRDDRKGQ